MQKGEEKTKKVNEKEVIQERKKKLRKIKRVS